MISPIIAAQTSNPVASVQQNVDSRGMINYQAAQTKVQENERQIRESVVTKDEAVLYDQRHDAKEEGRNKYVNLNSKKKKNQKAESESKSATSANRVNFDIKI